MKIEKVGDKELEEAHRMYNPFDKMTFTYDKIIAKMLMIIIPSYGTQTNFAVCLHCAKKVRPDYLYNVNS
jgi:hypothetical protein